MGTVHMYHSSFSAVRGSFFSALPAAATFFTADATTCIGSHVAPPLNAFSSATKCAPLYASQQSKHTTFCSEITPDSDAPSASQHSELAAEVRGGDPRKKGCGAKRGELVVDCRVELGEPTLNPQLETAAAPAAECASSTSSQQSKHATFCSEITPDSDAPPVSQLSTLNSQPSPKRRRWKRYARQIGRPTLLTEDIADAMYEAILRTGISDSQAGNLVKVSRASVCRWKQEDPAFADFLGTARVRFMAAQIRKIHSAAAGNKQLEMRKLKWLLEFSNPERWGRRPRKLAPSATKAPRRRVSATTVVPAAVSAETPLAMQSLASFFHPAGASSPAPEGSVFDLLQQSKLASLCSESAPPDAPSSVAPLSRPSPLPPLVPPATAAAPQSTSCGHAAPSVAMDGKAVPAVSAERPRTTHSSLAPIFHSAGVSVAAPEVSLFDLLQQSKGASKCFKSAQPDAPSSVTRLSRPLPLPSLVPSATAAAPQSTSCGQTTSAAPRQPSRKQRRREAHLARRAASKAARAAQRHSLSQA